MEAINGLIITSLETIHAYDRINGELNVYLDELDNTTISNSEEDKEITGKGGGLLKLIKQNKKVEITGDSATISGALLSAQIGSDPVYSNKTIIRKPDILTIGVDGTCKTTYRAIGEVGNEIGDLWIMSDNGDITSQDKYTQTASIEDIADEIKDKFTYNPETRVIQTPVGSNFGLKPGTQVAVFYDYETSGTTITNYADIFGKTLDVYIDVMATDVCDNVYKAQIHMPRGQFSGTFEINLDGEQVMHGFTINNLVDACAGSTKKLWDFIVYKDVEVA